MTNTENIRLKIMILTDRYPPDHTGGYHIACQRVVEFLKAHDHTVHVVTSKHEICRPAQVHGVYRLFHRLPPEGYPTFTPNYLFKQIMRMRCLHENRLIALELAEHLSPDVIFVWQSDGMGIGVPQALQTAGWKVVHRVDDCALAALCQRLRFDRNYLWRISRHVLYGVQLKHLQFPYVLVVSHFLKKRYLKAGLAADDVSVIYNGVPKANLVSNIKLRINTSSKIRLLFAGRVCHAKGVHIAIQALAKLNRRGVQRFYLNIAGPVDDAYSKELRKLISSLNLTEFVSFLGMVAHEKMNELYDSNDALLFPSSIDEGFGLVIIEAMARGLPTIVTNHGGPKEIVTHMENGLVFGPGDSDSLTQEVRRLFKYPDLLCKIRANAVKTVREKFTLERSGKLTETYLRRVAHSATQSIYCDEAANV